MRKKKETKRAKFFYFLSAIYYCLWRFDIKLDKAIEKSLEIIWYPIWLITPEGIKENYRKNKALRQMDRYNIKNVPNGFEDRYLMAACMPYVCLFTSSIPFGLILKFYDDYNFFIALILVLPPLIITDIPLNKGVLKKDVCIKNFKKFENNDTRWRRKWERITFAFCLGSIFSAILGFWLTFAIATGDFSFFGF